jgi:ribosomal protein L11 methyltransferase
MKSSKPLWRISVTIAPEAEDAAAEMLGAISGAATVTYLNLETNLSTATVFCEQKPDSKKIGEEIKAGLKRIMGCGLDIRPGKFEITKVKREDWAESWKRHFHPMEIGKTLLVKPSWSKRRPKRGQCVVILDPGLSFGTGQHPTTSFCLHEIVRRQIEGRDSALRCPGTAARRPCQSFLDIGTGSGILAIAAVKLGFAPVHAFDFDPESVRVSKENARKNRVADKIKLTCGDITKQPLKAARQYDLVCANLISNLLIAERRRIVNRLNPGGTLVLAGILAAEFAEVERAFADFNLKLVAKRVENEWCSGAFSFA